MPSSRSDPSPSWLESSNQRNLHTAITAVVEGKGATISLIAIAPKRPPQYHEEILLPLAAADFPEFNRKWRSRKSLPAPKSRIPGIMVWITSKQRFFLWRELRSWVWEEFRKSLPRAELRIRWNSENYAIRGKETDHDDTARPYSDHQPDPSTTALFPPAGEYRRGEGRSGDLHRP